MKKRVLALLIMCAMLLTLLAACGSSSDSSTSTSSSSSSSETEETSEEAEEEAGEAEEAEAESEETAEEAEEAEEEAEAEAEAETVVITYPVTEEVVTYTLSYSAFSVISMMLENGYSDSPFYDAFEEATGVRFEATLYESTTYEEKMNLLIVSQSLPDVIGGLLSIYTNGAAQAIEEETALDITPYLETCMPDYLAAINQFEGGLASLTTDEGGMGAIYKVYTEDYAYSNGYFIRDDMLEATGMDVPETLDEFLDLLRALKANGVEYPLYVNTDGDETGVLMDIWFNEWGYMNWYWDVETESVQYSHVQDYNYDYMLWLQDVWEEGLFLSSGAADVMGMSESFNDLFILDQVAVFTGKIDTIDEELQSLSTETGATAIPFFTGEYTEQGELMSIVGQESVSVNADVEDPETLLKAINYLYTEEGSHLTTYGVEGIGFEYNEDGEEEYTDLIMNNENVAQRFAMAYYTSPTLPGLYDPYAISYTWSEHAQAASEVWESAYTGNSATFDESVITLTEDEQDVINLYMSDLDTYCTETLYKFVYNASSLTEETFDDFVDTCYNTLHLQDILDVYTDAWLRYLERMEG